MVVGKRTEALWVMPLVNLHKPLVWKLMTCIKVT